LDLELDALALDYDPPRLDPEHAENGSGFTRTARDDVTFTDQAPIDDRLW
jgi:hypothetical protein